MRRSMNLRGTDGTYGRFLRLHKVLIAICLFTLLGQPASAEPRLLAFGDSLTQGYGLPPQDGFVPQLEAWLREHGHEEAIVINGGVSGDTTTGGRNRIAWSLSEPVDAVLVALGGNDLLRGVDPTLTHDNLDAILSEIDGRGLPVLLAGLPAPANYGADYQKLFTAAYTETAEKYGALYVPSFVAGITEIEDVTEARALMQPDGIHPNADGVRRNIEAIGPKVLELLERIGS